ncbi:aldo/keto reductase [Colibacter massiliensis]|uniref:aldo/keto reductase n=1 Tax=Colibacter massiliensis TaxID=1852379 RepID=UPI003F90ADB6
MEKRKLGDLEVSAVGLGCMGFSHAYGTATEADEAEKNIRAAYEMGYTFFDTAECYLGETADGQVSYNEELVGKALRDVRDKVVIATKFGVKHLGDQLLTDSSPAAIIKAVDGSLKRLGVDCIDLYYQHRIDSKTEPEEVASVMAELIKAGKISHWGISEANEEYLRRAHAVCPVTAVENRYSMLARWHESLFPVCEELGVGFVAFSPMGNGFLSGKYQSGDSFTEGDFRNTMPQYTPEGFEAAKSLLDRVGNLAKVHNATMAQISLAWMLTKKKYIVPIPGSRKLTRMQENAGAAEVLLTAEEIKELDAALAQMDLPVFGGHQIR